MSEMMTRTSNPPEWGKYEPVGQFEYPKVNMSLRDWFAGQVINSSVLAIHIRHDKDPGGEFSITDEMIQEVADTSYRLANAMMERRKGGVKPEPISVTDMLEFKNEQWVQYAYQNKVRLEISLNGHYRVTVNREKVYEGMQAQDAVDAFNREINK